MESAREAQPWTRCSIPTPFEEWLSRRLEDGAAGVDLVQAIGAQDHVGTDLSEAQARERLQSFASHPKIGGTACEIIRMQSRKLQRNPPFPFATWLEECRNNSMTTAQVKRRLGLKLSCDVEETVTVLHDFESQSRTQILLKKDLQGSVKRYDDEGDALMEFEGIDDTQWVIQADFPKLTFAEPEAHWQALWTLASESNAWDIVASMMLPSKIQEQPPRAKIARIEGYESVSRLIARSRNILVLAGAGISAACGLPTFRDDDRRPAIAREFGLASADSVSEIATFRKDPRPWYKWIKEIIPTSTRPVQPSLTHRFVRHLEQQGKLLRMYTQNIDTLEHVSGISKVVYCHGSFATATCMQCGEQLADATPVNEAIAAGEIPRCTACNGGVMKPDVVLFGEPMPRAVMTGLEQDTATTDLLLVLGTSLSVAPCSFMPSLVGASPGDAPRVLINMEKAGKDSDFECFLPGPCDDTIKALLQHLGWETETILVE